MGLQKIEIETFTCCRSFIFFNVQGTEIIIQFNVKVNRFPKHKITTLVERLTLS